jgi:hypothetical protein
LKLWTPLGSGAERIDYKHVDGWSESVIEYIRALESAANNWLN